MRDGKPLPIAVEAPGSLDRSDRDARSFTTTRDENFGLTPGAFQRVVGRRLLSKLEYRLLGAVETVCTQVGARIFLAMCRCRFVRIRERIRSDHAKLVILRIQLKINQAAAFFFEVAATVGERRNRILRRAQVVSHFIDRGLDSTLSIPVETADESSDRFPAGLENGSGAFGDSKGRGDLSEVHEHLPSGESTTLQRSCAKAETGERG